MADEQDARFARIEANGERLESDIGRIEADVRALTSDMQEVRPSLSTIAGALPHCAAKEAGDQARHEATKGQYGVLVGVVAFLLSPGTLATKYRAAESLRITRLGQPAAGALARAAFFDVCWSGGTLVA